MKHGKGHGAMWAADLGDTTSSVLNSFDESGWKLKKETTFVNSLIDVTAQLPDLYIPEPNDLYRPKMPCSTRSIPTQQNEKRESFVAA